MRRWTQRSRDAGIAQPDVKWRERARKLFASALETPGGLKVQTIHALCTRLLQQFPFEAKVPARFTVLDERDQTEIMERASLSVMLDASQNPDSAAGRALRLPWRAPPTSPSGRGARGLSQPRSLHDPDRSAGSIEQTIRDGADALGVDPAERIEDVEREIVDGPNLPRALSVPRRCSTGSSSDQDQAKRLRKALRHGGDPRKPIDYLDVFLTGDEPAQILRYKEDQRCPTRHR